MKSLAPIICLLGALLAACGAQPAPGHDDPIAQGRRWVESRALRRQVLEASLENPDNLYSQTRLANYATAEGGWEALPVRRPAVHVVTMADFGTFDGRGRRAATSDESDGRWQAAWTHDALMALGKRGFETYPMRVDMRLAPVVTSADEATQSGFWIDDAGRVGGLVAQRLADGDEMASWTCSTCHSSVRERGGPVVAGRSNSRLNVPELYRLDGLDASGLAHWRPGQTDPSRDHTDNPTAIPDLRAVRFQSHLHWDATVKNSLLALAERIDTLLIISQDQTNRPPRQLAFAMAYYLWNLPVERTNSGGANVDAGRQIFAEQCSRCHHADGTVGPPVDYRLVGTDPVAAQSPARTTGRYRVPSLAGVGDYGYFLHDGSVRSLEQLFDPQRLDDAPGHPHGLSLSDPDRAASDQLFANASRALICFQTRLVPWSE